MDDTVSLGTNGNTANIDVLANDSGYDISIRFILDPAETISATWVPTAEYGLGMLVIDVEHIPTQGEKDAWVQTINAAIANWETHQLNEIQEGYSAAMTALNNAHAFLTQWDGTNEWLVGTAGNTVWALSSVLGGTAVGVAGMALSAWAAAYDIGPNVSDTLALEAAQRSLINQLDAENNAVEQLAAQARAQLPALLSSLGNGDTVANQTFTYGIQGYIDEELIDFAIDDATVTVDLGGRLDYSRHIDALSALHSQLSDEVYGPQNFLTSEKDPIVIQGAILESVAAYLGFHLAVAWTGNPYNPPAPGAQIYWWSSDCDFWYLDGTDIAEHLTTIGYRGPY